MRWGCIAAWSAAPVPELIDQIMSMNMPNTKIDVDALMTKIRMDLDGSPVKVDAAVTTDELMARVRKEVEQRNAAQAESSAARWASEFEGRSTILPRWSTAFALEEKTSYSLAELTNASDRDFVEQAYRVLLRRDGDRPGIEGGLWALRSGTLTKTELLASIRWSSEGRARNIEVRGLQLSYLLQRMKRIPLVGGLVAWTHAFVRLPWMFKHLAVTDMARGRELSELGHHINHLARGVEDQLLDVSTLRDSLAEANESIRELFSRLERTQVELRASADELNLVRRQIIELERKLISGSADSVGSHAPAVAPLPSHALDDMYVEFEERFRGSPELIRARSMHYLEVVRKAGAGTKEAPVIDLGCGRGDWLDLLKENQLVAFGVDTNQAFLAMNRERGLDVIEGDALEALRGMASRSAGAITGMHIAEHLPFDVLVAMIDECLRVLRPGGVLVLETPNPENLLVASHYFYLDPTHRNPLPPEALRWIVEARHFVDVEIKRLTEARELVPGDRAPLELSGLSGVDQVLEMMRAAPDYAIVAKRP